MIHRWVEGCKVSKSLRGMKVCRDCKTMLKPDKSNEHQECESQKKHGPELESTG